MEPSKGSIPVRLTMTFEYDVPMVGDYAEWPVGDVLECEASAAETELDWLLKNAKLTVKCVRRRG